MLTKLLVFAHLVTCQVLLFLVSYFLRSFTGNVLRTIGTRAFDNVKACYM